MPLKTHACVAISVLFWLGAGCAPPPTPPPSGNPFAIVKAVEGDALLTKVGAPQGISVTQVKYGTTPNYFENQAIFDHEFDVKLASGTPEQLMTALRDEIKMRVENAGRTIVELRENRSDNKDLRAFDCHFISGSVRVIREHDAKGGLRIRMIAVEARN
jgi:hypothetical protein